MIYPPNAKRYRGIFWIDASSYSNAENSYAELGSLFGKGRTAAAGRYWLSTFPRPWLLVVDNADDPMLDLSSIMPPGNAGQILITTRNPDFVSFSTIKPIRLTNMDPDEAIELLLRSAYPENQELWKKPSFNPIASAIAHKLGYLAIAIHLAGSTIRRKICTMEKYLTWYLSQRDLLLGCAMSLGREEEDIITTWEIPFRMIEARRSVSHQDAVAVLHVLASLHHESIPELLLQAPMLMKLAPDLDVHSIPPLFQSEQAGSDVARVRLRSALRILYEYSIIELDSAKGVCSLHPVVHEWARSRINASGKIQHWLRCTAFVLSCADTNSESTTYMNPSLILPHLDSFFKLARDCSLDLLTTPNGPTYLEKLALIYEQAGCWPNSLGILIPLVHYLTWRMGARHEQTLAAKRRASLCYWNLFEVGQAISLQLQIVASRWVYRRSILAWSNPIKPMHVEYLLALSDLTQSLWLAGLRNASKVAGERAVVGLRQQLGPHHVWTLEASFHLARTYRHLGVLETAHTMLVENLRDRRRILGRTHLDTLMTLNELGMSFKSRKRNLALAEQLVRQVLKIRKEILGEEHAYTLWSVNDLAKVICARDRPAEAIVLLEQAIPCVSRTLGNDHVGMQMTKGNLALAYAQQHRWQEAETLLEELISQADRTHPDWLKSMIGCIRLHIRLQKFGHAKDKCNTVITFLERPRDSVYKDLLRNVQKRNWVFLARSFVGWYIGGRTDDSTNLRVVVGLLFEVHRLTGDLIECQQLKARYPDLEEDALDQLFELT